MAWKPNMWSHDWLQGHKTKLCGHRVKQYYSLYLTYMNIKEPLVSELITWQLAGTYSNNLLKWTVCIWCSFDNVDLILLLYYEGNVM